MIFRSEKTRTWKNSQEKTLFKKRKKSQSGRKLWKEKHHLRTSIQEGFKDETFMIQISFLKLLTYCVTSGIIYFIFPKDNHDNACGPQWNLTRWAFQVTTPLFLDQMRFLKRHETKYSKEVQQLYQKEEVIFSWNQDLVTVLHYCRREYMWKVHPQKLIQVQ